MKIILLILLLFGCNQKVYLNGTYTSELLNTQTIYEFSKDEVKVKLIVNGILLINENGQYEINEDKDEITFIFSNLINDRHQFNGSFTFEENKHAIKIGQFEFKKK